MTTRGSTANRVPGTPFARRSGTPAARRRAIVGSPVWGYAAALPAGALIVVFFVYPAFIIGSRAFTSWDGIEPPTFNGLDNFAALAGDGDFLTALRNNGLFALFVPVQVLLSLVVAMLIYERTPGWRVFRAIFFLPVVMSPVVIGIVWTAIFNINGPLNLLLEAVGLGDLTTNWLATPLTSLPAMMVVVLWASFGFNMALFLSGLSTLPTVLVDAARVDGAGWWTTLIHVIAPSLRRVTEFVVVLNLITAFAFMLPYVFVMTGGGPGRATFVVEFLIYDEGFTFGKVGYASAISLALFAIVSLLMLVYVRLLGKNDR
jgi:multiple sugar transport system permease protein